MKMVKKCFELFLSSRLRPAGIPVSYTRNNGSSSCASFTRKSYLGTVKKTWCKWGHLHYASNSDHVVLGYYLVLVQPFW